MAVLRQQHWLGQHRSGGRPPALAGDQRVLASGHAAAAAAPLACKAVAERVLSAAALAPGDLLQRVPVLLVEGCNELLPLLFSQDQGSFTTTIFALKPLMRSAA